MFFGAYVSKIVRYEFGHFAYFSTQVSGFSFFILSSSVCDLHLESFLLEFGLWPTISNRFWSRSSSLLLKQGSHFTSLVERWNCLLFGFPIYVARCFSNTPFVRIFVKWADFRPLGSFRIGSSSLNYELLLPLAIFGLLSFLFVECLLIASLNAIFLAIVEIWALVLVPSRRVKRACWHG